MKYFYILIILQSLVYSLSIDDNFNINECNKKKTVAFTLKDFKEVDKVLTKINIRSDDGLSFNVDSSLKGTFLLKDGYGNQKVKIDRSFLDGSSDSFEKDYEIKDFTPNISWSSTLPSSVYENDSISASVKASDTCNDTLSYYINNNPSWLSIDSNGQLKGTATSTGSWNISTCVKDTQDKVSCLNTSLSSIVKITTVKSRYHCVGGDDSYCRVNLPFSLYGKTSIYPNTNGYITFGSGRSNYSGYYGRFSGYYGPSSSDLMTNVYVTVKNDRVIIEWSGGYYSNWHGSYTHTMTLYKNGSKSGVNKTVRP